MDNNALDGKVALVTGGGRGIGAAVALRLAEDGADIALTFQRNQERADDMVARIKAVGRRALAIPAGSADPAALVAAGGRGAGGIGRAGIPGKNARPVLLRPPGETGLGGVVGDQGG